MSSNSKDGQDLGRLIDCPSDAAWDAFILASPQCSVFSLSGYLAGLGVAHAKLFYELDGQVAASALIVKPGDSEFRAPFPYSLYQGVALAPMSGQGHSTVSKRLKITSGLAEALCRRYPHHSLCLHRSLIDLRGFQWCNYNAPDQGTYELSLSYTGVIHLDQFSSFEGFLSSIRTARRQDAKKAEKAGLRIESSRDVDEFTRLYALTFARQGIPSDDSHLDLVQRIVHSVLKTGLGQMLVARNSAGQAASAIVTAHDPNCAYYLFGATDPAFRADGPNSALLLHVIRDAFMSKKKAFDMVGVNSPQRGDFKISFNAEPTPFFLLTPNSNSDPLRAKDSDVTR